MPEKVYIDRGAADHPLAERVLALLKGAEVEIVDGPRQAAQAAAFESDPVAKAKLILYLDRQKAGFLKNCPGTKGHLCCDYRVMDLVENCHLDCTYCILQSYVNQPYMAVHLNLEDAFEEIRAMVCSGPSAFFRIGTGELSDSLALDWLTGFSQYLVPFFAGLKNAELELKTKTDCVEPLLGLDHGGRTIVAWSLSPEGVALMEEPCATPVARRIKAAARCQAAGYKVAFHFDPVFIYPGWEDDYRRLVFEALSSVDPGQVAWVSAAGFRYTAQLKEVIRKRFPRSRILLGEFARGADGKWRYLEPIRAEMYKKIYGWIKSISNEVPFYLCMESESVWRKVFGRSPSRNFSPYSLKGF